MKRHRNNLLRAMQLYTIGRAGAFLGHVQINGTLNVTRTKNFKIDHPLDPENKYLYHAAIESSEVLNVYNPEMMRQIKETRLKQIEELEQKAQSNDR